MVYIENAQKAITIDTKALAADAQRILDMLEYSDYDLSILLTTNEVIQQYNKQYRHKDVPTDILSFPFHQLRPGERIKPVTDDDKNIGDLIISLEYVNVLYAANLYARMQKLLVHGVCHLLGHDHDTEATDKEMLALEDYLLVKLQSIGTQ